MSESDSDWAAGPDDSESESDSESEPARLDPPADRSGRDRRQRALRVPSHESGPGHWHESRDRGRDRAAVTGPWLGRTVGVTTEASGPARAGGSCGNHDCHPSRRTVCDDIYHRESPGLVTPPARPRGRPGRRTPGPSDPGRPGPGRVPGPLPGTRPVAS